MNQSLRAYIEIKNCFLSKLPEYADFSDVIELIGTGTFTNLQEAVLKALDKDDWLGFDYPAQAISAAFGDELANYDASPEVLLAVSLVFDLHESLLRFSR